MKATKDPVIIPREGFSLAYISPASIAVIRGESDVRRDTF